MDKDVKKIMNFLIKNGDLILAEELKSAINRIHKVDWRSGYTRRIANPHTSVQFRY